MRYYLSTFENAEGGYIDAFVEGDKVVFHASIYGYAISENSRSIAWLQGEAIKIEDDTFYYSHWYLDLMIKISGNKLYTYINNQPPRGWEDWGGIGTSIIGIFESR